MDPRGLRAAALTRLLALLALTLTLPAAAEPPPEAVEYLYVESNEGGSSGGHVGLRIGADVYHFQQRDRWLRLLRGDAGEFFAEYALAGNRPVHALRLDVDAEAASRLRERFELRRRAGESHARWLLALRADRALLEGSRPLEIPGAGFFFASSPAPAPARPDPTLTALRERIAARYGAGFLAQREAELRERLAALVPAALPALPALPALAASHELPLANAWSAQAADLAAARSALELLRAAPPLRAGSSFALPGALDAAERAALCGFRAAVSDELVALAGAPHPGWGSAFLVGAARLLALERSCAGGMWVTLDVFAGAPVETLPAPRPDALAALSRDADATLAQARGRFTAAAPDGRRLAQVEAVAGLARELRRAARQGRLRVAEALVPQRAAARFDLPPPPLSRAQVAALLDLMRARERDAERAFGALHAYRLASHNCVSELLATLDAALGDGAAAGPARVVPFLSADAVRERHAVAGERVIPSLRALRVAAAAGDPIASLRELSPLTARSFAAAASDSRFVLFTDSAPALRPLFGVANLVTGLGAAAAGLARAPWDGGAELSAGLRGAFWSLPELAFFSVRKGTNEYVAPEWIAWAESQADAGGARAEEH